MQPRRAHVGLRFDRLPRILVGKAAESTHIAAAIEVGLGPAFAFRRRLAVWISRRISELQNVDQGAGVYASMMWMAPNIFVATPIRSD